MESIKGTEIAVGGQNIINKQHQHVKIEKMTQLTNLT